jgi:hypothetical protein
MSLFPGPPGTIRSGSVNDEKWRVGFHARWYITRLSKYRNLHFLSMAVVATVVSAFSRDGRPRKTPVVRSRALSDAGKYAATAALVATLTLPFVEPAWVEAYAGNSNVSTIAKLETNVNAEFDNLDTKIPIARQVQAKQRQNLVSAAAGKVRVTIGFKSKVSDATIQALPQGVTVLYRSKYVNAVIVEMDKTLVSAMRQDRNVEYIQEDSMVYSIDETVPRGIPAIQANDGTVQLIETSRVQASVF